MRELGNGHWEEKKVEFTSKFLLLVGNKIEFQNETKHSDETVKILRGKILTRKWNFWGKVHDSKNRERILRWSLEFWGKSENSMCQNSKNNARRLRTKVKFWNETQYSDETVRMTDFSEFYLCSWNYHTVLGVLTHRILTFTPKFWIPS